MEISLETNWLGIIPYKDICVAVHAGQSSKSPDALEIKADMDWPVDVDNRASSYDRIYWKMREYISRNEITDVVLKAGAFGPDGRASGNLIPASELRGVLMAAAITICPVRLMNKASITRKYGSKNIQ